MFMAAASTSKTFKLSLESTPLFNDAYISFSRTEAHITLGKIVASSGGVTTMGVAG
jgi:hypothetical protein